MAGVDELSDLIVEELEEYSDEVDDKMQTEIDAVTKEALQRLENHPNLKKLKGTGEYARSFYKKTLARGTGYTRNVIANRKYQIAHLLEYGHAVRGGGRTRAFPHWQDAQKIVDKLPERLKAAIKK